MKFSFLPCAVLIAGDYLGIVASQLFAFRLRDWLDTWNRVAFSYDFSLVFGAIPLFFLICNWRGF